MSLLAKMQKAGFQLLITDAGNLQVTPASKLTSKQREFIKIHKAELISELQAQFETLKAAIINACHARGDNQQNITELIQECETDCHPNEWPLFIKYFNHLQKQYEKQ